MELMVGAVLGFLSGLGIGGGSLLILYLTMWAGASQETARGINLLFFLPCAAISSLMRRKQWNGKKTLPAMIAGCAAAGVFTWIAGWADTELLKKLFGGLLIATGVREIGFPWGKPARRSRD